MNRAFHKVCHEEMIKTGQKPNFDLQLHPMICPFCRRTIQSNDKFVIVNEEKD
jgi:hypothetical protein